SDYVFEKFDDELAYIISPPEYECFYFDIEPDPRELTTDVVKNIYDNSIGELNVHVPNVLPTQPTLYLALDFTLPHDFPVQSMRFLSLDELPHISFISDPLSSVFETLLPFSSKNEDKVFNHGILASKEEKSPHLLSHRGFKAFTIITDFFYERPMMISGENIRLLDDYPDFEASRTRGFVRRSLKLRSLNTDPITTWDRVSAHKPAGAGLHSQANGQVEVANREIMKGVEKRMKEYKACWVDKLSIVNPKQGTGLVLTA
ncbi:hypothetical protein Tco_0978171, partial [Tanacetum coccineum]